MAGSKGRLRNACFTINNWKQDDIDLFEDDLVKYMIAGQETCPKTKTPHLQGYIEFAKQLSWAAAKRILPRAHIEKRLGTAQEAIDYCLKEGGPYFEKGERNIPGKRRDIDAAKTWKTWKEAVDNASGYQALRLYEKLESKRPLSKEFREREVYWFYGATGTGKTMTAYNAVPEGEEFWVSNLDGGKWFDGYTGQEWAILDELRAEDYPYRFLLRLLDGREVRVPVKGGFACWNPEVVIITTPHSPQATYHDELVEKDGGIDQLLRRITQIREFVQVNNSEPGLPGPLAEI